MKLSFKKLTDPKYVPGCSIMKRSLTQVEAAESDNIHAARKRPLAYTEADAELASIYEDLADDVPITRIQAASRLLKRVLSEPSDRQNRLETAIARLVKGLCSGRKAARLGFSVALSELLRVAFRLGYSNNAEQFSLKKITDDIVFLTRVDGRASGQARRDHLIGRRFAFQAVLQSEVAEIKALTIAEWQGFLQALLELALQKSWLRSECGALLYEYLQSPSGEHLATERLKSLIGTLQQAEFFHTAEGATLWLHFRERCPDLLPRGVWRKNDPLSAEERVRLKKLLQGDAVVEDIEGERTPTPRISSFGSRQPLPSFAWKVILAHLYRRGASSDFRSFWSEVVDNSLFADSSSNERKSLGLQVLSLGISSAPPPLLPDLLSRNVVRCLINHRADPGRYLFEAASVPLSNMVERARQDSQAASMLLRALYTIGGLTFDQLTKTKTVISMTQHTDLSALSGLVSALRAMMNTPGTIDMKQLDQRRRAVADTLATILRTHREPSQVYHNREAGTRAELAPWLKDLLQVLVDFSYTNVGSPPATETVRQFLRTKLMSCLGMLLDHEPHLAVTGPSHVADILRAETNDLVMDMSERSREALAQGHKLRAASGLEESSVALAFELLYDLSIIQVYSQEPDSVEALQDLNSSLQLAQTEGGDPTSILVELILSFASKPSATFRKLAERAFGLVSESLTPESIVSMLEILQTKEGAGGQQELFAHEDENQEGESNEQAESDSVDVEDLSDVELVNGEDVDMVEGEEVPSDDSSESSSEGEEGSVGGEEAEDEETVFDRKLAEALGTTGPGEGSSDEDGSDMDDEQMMALEPSLTNIFKERKRGTSNKQDNKEAKENIVNFKNRVLDLLLIYVKKQFADATALHLILPLATLTRTATTKPTRSKAFDVLQSYFQACIKARHLPRPDDPEVCFTFLSALHQEMGLDGAILHADACSRSCLFLSRVLIALDGNNFERIEEMYKALLVGKQSNPNSKIRDSVFTEWESWKRNSSEHFGKWAGWLRSGKGN